MARRPARRPMPALVLQPGGDQLPPWVRLVSDRRDLPAAKRPQITGPDQIYDVVKDIAFDEVEHVVVLTLDARCRVIRRHEVTRGIVDSSLIHPREVFRAAIADAAVGLIVVHNHPSGDPTPSQADRAVTRGLVEGGRMLDIPVYDSVIVAHDEWLSFGLAGLL